MKEATGELNMTVITVAVIGVLLAFFYLAIWPTIRNNLALSNACSASNNGTLTYDDPDAGISCSGGACTYTPQNGSPVTRSCEDNSRS